MPYVITEACKDTKDRACVDVCPVDCIYEGAEQLYIHPDECIDCGACGGHPGDINARAVAALLNDAPIRAGLYARGIEIPPTTHFVAALHNTTTDEVTLFDLTAIATSHQADWRRAR
jgi:hypothetical protein